MKLKSTLSILCLLTINTFGYCQDIKITRTKIKNIPDKPNLMLQYNYQYRFTDIGYDFIKVNVAQQEINKISFHSLQNVSILENGLILVSDRDRSGYKGWKFYSQELRERKHIAAYDTFDFALNDIADDMIVFASQESENNFNFNLTVTDLEGNIIQSKFINNRFLRIKNLKIVNGNIILLLDLEEGQRVVGFNKDLRLLFKKDINSYFINGRNIYSETHNSLTVMALEEMINVNLNDGSENWRISYKKIDANMNLKELNWAAISVFEDNYIAFTIQQYDHKKQLASDELMVRVLDVRNAEIIFYDKLKNYRDSYKLVDLDENSFILSNQEKNFKYQFAGN